MRDRKLTTKSSGESGPTARDRETPRRHEGFSAAPPERALRHPPHRRVTETIELASARDVRAALVHAMHIGLLPNRHLVLNWKEMMIEDSIAATGMFLKLLRDAARRRGARVAYVWVRETGPVVGDHTHILLHVSGPNGWFARRKAGWLKRCGAVPCDGSSKTRIIRGSRQSSDGGLQVPELYNANLRNLEAYVLKHCSTDVSRAFGFKGEGPCTVVGKRVSISQNLHRKARTKCAICTFARG